MDYLESLRVFASIAEVRSFADVARRMTLSTGTVTRTIASLEKKLNTRLLHRTTRQVTLTEAGQIFLDGIRHIVVDLDEIEGVLRASSKVASGTLRLAVQSSLGVSLVARLLKSYRAKYPLVVPQVFFIDGSIDFVDQRFDAAITLEGFAHSSSVITRQLSRCRLYLVGATQYFVENGLPGQVSDLESLTLLCDDSSPDDLVKDTMRRGNSAQLCASTVIRSNSSDMIRRMALEGMGVALIAEHLVDTDIDAGRLRRILPDFPLPETGMQVAFASRRNLPPNVRALVDCLVEEFQKVPQPLQPLQMSRRDPEVRLNRPGFGGGSNF